MSLHNRANRQAPAAGPAQTQTAAEPAPSFNTPRMAQFSDADFQTAWNKCAEAFPGEPILHSALTMTAPRKTGGHTYELGVTSTMQLDILQRELPKICALLRDTLSNDAVELSVRLVEAELSPQFWTEKQVLEHMLANHPEVGELMTKYKMRLS